MTKRAGASGRSGLGLRLIHAIVFLGLACSTVVAVSPELLQLARALWQPFHTGAPPSALGVAAALVAVAGAGPIALRLPGRRPAPLWASGLVLAGLTGAMLAQGHDVDHRTAAGANAALLKVGRGVLVPMNARLQEDARVPTALADWQAEVQRASALAPSDYRTRSFARLPFQAALGGAKTAAAPGTVLVEVTQGEVGFTLRFVGVDDRGQPALLRDAEGLPVELKGVFNPDSRSP